MGESNMCHLNPHLLEDFLCDSEAIEGSRNSTIDCRLEKYFRYLFLGKTVVDCAANMQLEFVRPV
jgi:hypothetical protein